MHLNIFYYKEKREQRFLNDLQNPDNGVIVIDFCCNGTTLEKRKYKPIYLCCLPQVRKKSMLYSNYYKGKDKFAIGVFLCDIYSKELFMDSDMS